MTLSEVFYEAACNISDGGFRIEDMFTCYAVSAVGGEPACREYSTLMANSFENEGPDHCFLNAVLVTEAGEDIGWSREDFRTFMLLMASEAVK